MEGTLAKRGEVAVYAAGYFKIRLRALRAPVLDPVAKLKKKRGAKGQTHAVELFAVALLRHGAEGVKHQITNRGARSLNRSKTIDLMVRFHCVSSPLCWFNTWSTVGPEAVHSGSMTYTQMLSVSLCIVSLR